jgi:hypothetical protein
MPIARPAIARCSTPPSRRAVPRPAPSHRGCDRIMLVVFPAGPLRGLQRERPRRPPPRASRGGHRRRGALRASSSSDGLRHGPAARRRFLVVRRGGPSPLDRFLPHGLRALLPRFLARGDCRPCRGSSGRARLPVLRGQLLRSTRRALLLQRPEMALRRPQRRAGDSHRLSAPGQGARRRILGPAHRPVSPGSLPLPDGHFRYQIRRTHRVDIPYMRWSQAWAVRALAELRRSASSRDERRSRPTFLSVPARSLDDGGTVARCP